MNYFDIHSHLYFKDFDTDRDRVILNMKERGIYTVSVGTNLETSKQAIKLAEENENLFASVGVHPAHFDSDIFDKEFMEIVKHPKVVCIGECGFDYFRTEGDLTSIKKIQKDLFEKQIQLSLDGGKALMLHCRPSKGSMDAYLDTLYILESYKTELPSKIFGNAHFFAGDLNILKRFLDLGFTVSFTGVMTFTKDYDELIKYAPNDMIHAETDAPFVAPTPFRSKRNSPEYIDIIVKKMAEIKSIKEEDLRLDLLKNAKKLFAL
jgi:TatD DNase family protein